jgi:hypothetical protein
MVRDHGWQGHQQKSKELFALKYINVPNFVMGGGI